MNYNIGDIEEGDVVTVRSSFGSGPIVVGVVDNVEEDIKNGVPGIDYTDGEGNHRWAYIDQVTRVDHPVRKATK